MRTPLLLVGILLVVACGGDSGPNPPAPPPPPPGPPATVSIQSGDNQSAEPGVAVPVRPAVIVKDAGGRAVAGASVAFAVDSGGGTVTGASATTGSDGVATVGAWQLGPVEGRQILVATVGALTPVRFVATGAITPRTISDTSLTSGQIVISTGALAGTKLEVPAGAFAGSQQWKLEIQPNTDWPRRPGVAPVGPGLRITSPTTGFSAVPMRLTLPATVPVGTKPFVLMRSAAGAIQVLPTVDIGPNTVTVATFHFDATMLDQLAATGGFQAAARADDPTGPEDFLASRYDAKVIVSAIPAADLDKDVDTGYRPAVDDWEFPSNSTTGSERLAMGKAVSSLAYFTTLKGPGRPLWKRWQEAENLGVSNRLGFRFASVAAEIFPVEDMLAGVTGIRSSVRPTIVDQVFHDVIKANLLVTGLPQLLFAEVAPLRQEVVVAYRTQGGDIHFADPNRPGDPSGKVTFAHGNFVPTTVGIGPNGETASTLSISSVCMGLFIRFGVIEEEMKKAAEGTPVWEVDPKKPSFPDYVLEASNGFVENDLIVLTDTTRTWVDCPGCLVGLNNAFRPGKLQPYVVYAKDGATWVPVASGAEQGVRWSLTEPRDTRVGINFIASRSGGTNGVWLDWKFYQVKKWVVDVTAPTSVGVGSATAYTVAVRGPTLPAHRFVWKFGAAPHTQTILTTTPSTTFTFNQEGSAPIEVEVRRTSDDKVIARGSKMVSVETVFPVWRITTATADIGVVPLTPGQRSFWSADVAAFVADSMFWTQVKNGHRDGALVFATTPVPTLITRGIYMMAQTPVDFPNLPAKPGALTMFPLARTAAQSSQSTVEPLLNGSYVESGVFFDAARVQGRLWVTSTSSPTRPGSYRVADVTFTGTTATGTLDLTYRAIGGVNNEVVVATWHTRVTFEATRVR